MKKIYFALVAILFSVLYFSCSKDSATPTPTTAYLDLPSSPFNYAGGNDMGTLGRVLFYDTHLSVNNSISCASCHNQARAFSDNVALSSGFESRLTSRNTPPIQNLLSSSNLFWDGRDQFLSAMVLRPISNHVEMGMSDGNVMANSLRALPYYETLFTNAFGSPEITPDRISSALTVFVKNIRSVSSPFDMSQAGEGHLSGLAAEGKTLFFEKYNCNVCHQTQNSFSVGYTDSSNTNTVVQFVNIGLEMNYADEGRAAFTHDPADVGKFKIPNLHNVALTAPYMHDGRFATLEEVLDHYSHGIVDHPNLDPKLKGADGRAMQMNITSSEKASIIAFLNSLTDFTMITDPRLSNPFKIR